MPKRIKANLIKDDTIQLLHKFKILRNLSLDEIRIILGKDEEENYQKKIAKLLSFDPKEMIIKQGEFDSWIFWIVKGSYAVIQGNSRLATLKKTGEVFGEMTPLHGEGRTASVITLDKGVCLCIDMSILDSIDNDSISTKILEGIENLKEKRLKNTQNKISSGDNSVSVEEDEEDDIEISQSQLKELESALNIKEQELDEKEKVLDEKEKVLDEKEKILDQKEIDLEVIRKELEEKSSL